MDPNNSGTMSSAGWTCATCGKWIGANEIHYCGGAPSSAVPVAYPEIYPETYPPTDPIVARLDRIIAMLKELERRQR
jgi:hypothetical protein